MNAETLLVWQFNQTVSFAAGFRRPVVLFGAIADAANEKLASEMPDLFAIASQLLFCFSGVKLHHLKITCFSSWTVLFLFLLLLCQKLSQRMPALRSLPEWSAWIPSDKLLNRYEFKCIYLFFSSRLCLFNCVHLNNKQSNEPLSKKGVILKLDVTC